MDTVEALTKAKELISDPSKWTKGVAARDAQGNPTKAEYPEAVCWCALGALFKVTGHNSPHSEAFGMLADGIRDDEVVSEWNDTHTHAEVMDLFDRAIIKAKAAQDSGN